ncbi:MAG: universal stress protein [SAR202 cluster bacterium]|jgi:nucleotide-binding universal stress UspA family protein|nr:universal stress protein [SAR202 cluster bacterium]MDP6713015.1 universal stress protein [SAR202 cluster bacterium]
MTFHKMLVPLDGSEQSAGILPYAAQLAASLEIPVSLLTVIDPDASAVPERFRSPDEQARNDLEILQRSRIAEVEPAARRMLGNAAARLSNQGVTADYWVTKGVPAVEIVQAAIDLECGLIAMSTHGRNILSRAILGSVTDKVLHTSSVPVLTTTMAMKVDSPLEQVNISEAFVPLDGSALAELALPHALDLAEKLSLPVSLVNVVDTGGPYQGLMDDARYVEVDVEIRSKALEYLRKQSDDMRAKGINVRAIVRDGNPGVVLTELLREPRGRIVVMATHGLSGLTRWWLGSVTEVLVRSSADPVLVIPTSEQSSD